MIRAEIGSSTERRFKMPGTKVVVDLGDLKLPEAVARELETNIRSAVLATLGRVDFRKDFRIVGRPRFSRGTIGLVLKAERDG